MTVTTPDLRSINFMCIFSTWHILQLQASVIVLFIVLENKHCIHLGVFEDTLVSLKL